MKKFVVCDTNLLVSAAIFPKSVPAQAYEKAISEFDLAVSDQTILELSEVLKRSKFDKYLSTATIFFCLPGMLIYGHNHPLSFGLSRS